MGLQLGHHQIYYISQCEEKQSIQLTITVKEDDRKSMEDRRELIGDVNDIVKLFMREVETPTLMVPCPLCSILHITLSDVSTGHTIFCTQSKVVKRLSLGYYDDLISGSNDCMLASGDPTPIARGDDNALKTGIVISYKATYSICLVICNLCKYLIHL